MCVSICWTFVIDKLLVWQWVDVQCKPSCRYTVWLVYVVAQLRLRVCYKLVCVFGGVAQVWEWLDPNARRGRFESLQPRTRYAVRKPGQKVSR